MENKTISIIKSRVSCRAYSEKKVPLSKALQVAEAGKMAPSGMNRQIVNILVLRKKSVVEKLRKLAVELGGKDPYYGASTLILVYGPREDKFTALDGACVLENMFIAATALKIKKQLGIPEDARVVGTCILGYAKDPASLAVKERKADFVKVI